MKALLALAMATVLGGCAMLRTTMPAAPAAIPAKGTQSVGGVQVERVQVERIPFRVGVSSATVEQLARQHACVGQGAGLITEPGPVEVYRLQCGDGKVFMARCELRQCRKM
jgi:hypothetical protein